MPELPEVETVKEVLKPILLNHKFTKIMVLYERMILSPVATFEQSLTHKTITDITRHGKFLVFHFEDKTVLISHLRMEGKFIERQQNEDPTAYARVIFYMDDGRKLCFDDTRKFGIMKVSTEDRYLLEDPIDKLGPEPFYVDDPNYLLKRYSRIRKPIKETLLDQTIMAGLGNIYADEVDFACHLNPLTPANELTYDDCAHIIESSQKVLHKAIKLGGSTVRSYHANGIDGKFQNELNAYGKEGTRCPNNHYPTNFKKIFVGGRGTTYCPVCQKRRNKCFVLGITGLIASGKSTINKHLKELGYATISSDEIVKELYQDSNIQFEVSNLLGKDSFIDGNLNAPFIKEVIANEPKKKKELEKILHPQVRLRLESFIKEHINDHLVGVEIPLLYESNMDDLCDATIAIDATLEDQIHNLKARGHDVESSLVLNNTNKFKSYRNRLTFLLETNNDINRLKDEIEKITRAIDN